MRNYQSFARSASARLQMNSPSAPPVRLPRLNEAARAADASGEATPDSILEKIQSQVTISVKPLPFGRSTQSNENIQDDRPADNVWFSAEAKNGSLVVTSCCVSRVWATHADQFSVRIKKGDPFQIEPGFQKPQTSLWIGRSLATCTGCSVITFNELSFGRLHRPFTTNCAGLAVAVTFGS